MKKTFWKNSFKTIKHNISRFLAMFSIILLTSGVITGLLVAAPNLEMSMTEKFNDVNLADMYVTSTLPFNDENIETLRADFKDVEGVFMNDVLAIVNNVTTVQSILYNLDIENQKINRLTLIDGEYPKDETEILVQRETYYLKEFSVGSKVVINNIEYSVSGIVENTWYFSKEPERSVEGTNTIEAIFYGLKAENVSLYTHLFITVDKDKSMNQFSNSYTNLIDDEIIKLNEKLIDIDKQKLEFYGFEDYDIKNYVLDRSTNTAYQMYSSSMNSISTITQIFPIFFLIVSTLVVLTTMTRLIEEERQETGILRSLGYKRSDIYAKYLMYALVLSILGAGIGYAAGFRLIPAIINNTFKTIFFMPKLNTDIFSLSNVLYMVFIIISMVLTTVFAIRKTLRQNVATLMLPKAPKYGKRIFLEKIKFIWNNLKFKHKSSLRNLFRYPNNFIMTVLGIAGSLALVFTGFALTDSIKAVSTRQYGEIYKYDFTVNINELTDELSTYLDNNFNDYIEIKEFSQSLTSKDGKNKFYINVIIGDERLENFYEFKNRKTKEILNLNEEGILITEQISNHLKVKENDTIELAGVKDLKITGITENYMNNSIYMTSKYYEEHFSKIEQLTTKLLIKSSNIDDDLVKADFEKLDGFLSISFKNNELIAKERLLGQVRMIASVIILAAAFLAIIVIYNLTNVNISEREKELATLKVLGYKNLEVSNYIFREINVMTFVGIILGVPLGLLLFMFVIVNIDTPSMMMGRNISWYTYVISIALTVLFTVIVEIFMNTKIKKIDMIGALKEL
ncbi:ABC transporter permease [Haploplasma axanthum]|nr:FtsX-like permease family protein [Haploplasma axanthum]